MHNPLENDEAWSRHGTKTLGDLQYPSPRCCFQAAPMARGFETVVRSSQQGLYAIERVAIFTRMAIHKDTTSARDRFEVGRQFNLEQ